jgi:hypothetical protein
VLLANGAVFRHVASCLAHEPHRGHIDRFAAAGFQETAQGSGLTP